MKNSSQPTPSQQHTADTSRHVAEGARETKWDKPGFLRDLFLGKLRMDLVYPFPPLQGIDRPEFQAFYQKMKRLLEAVDSDTIDRSGTIPEEVRYKLASLGAFGMKIQKKYGGLEFSQAEYNHVMKLVGSYDSNIAALLSAHQSIGVPQPLIMFGNAAQKEKYLPRIARGAVTGFALTEPDVGSDPARLAATVSETEDGNAYILNGEKLWCTNGTIADLLVVMARHKEDNSISAFIVETGWEGVEVAHRCHFMGLRALENGHLRFHDVRIPKENLLWKKGQGLKLAFITLNTGRLTLPAIVSGGSKVCLNISRDWANERVQWGEPIGKHEAITHKIARMAANSFALESVADLTTALMEHDNDIRMEAAAAKMFNTEHNWQIIDDTLQIRGGRGYETSESLKARGEPGIPVERMLRDARVNLIFEGSSEIMRLFIAREAVDRHLQVAGTLLDPGASVRTKLAALPKIGLFYARWYVSLWIGWNRWPRYHSFRRLATHARFMHRTARKLARHIFYGMLWYGASLERKQAFLSRIVEIGVELYAMAATVSRAQAIFKDGNRNAVNLADLFCRQARRRIDARFKALWSNDDDLTYRMGRQVLDRQFTWLEQDPVEKGGDRKDKQLVEDEFLEESLISLYERVSI